MQYILSVIATKHVFAKITRPFSFDFFKLICLTYGTERASFNNVNYATVTSKSTVLKKSKELKACNYYNTKGLMIITCFQLCNIQKER